MSRAAQREVAAAAGMGLAELAAAYHAQIGVVCACSDYDLRQPLERHAEMLWAIGRFRFARRFNEALLPMDWPVPAAQRGTDGEAAGKTANPWDALIGEGASA